MFSQLRTGIARINSYLHRIGAVGSENNDRKRLVLLGGKGSIGYTPGGDERRTQGDRSRKAENYKLPNLHSPMRLIFPSGNSIPLFIHA